MQLTLSNNFVFALNHAGELLCRHGVSPDHVTGDYWKKLPGEIIHISGNSTMLYLFHLVDNIENRGQSSKLV